MTAAAKTLLAITALAALPGLVFAKDHKKKANGVEVYWKEVPAAVQNTMQSENVRRFNEDEAVWRCFKKKRALRKRLLRLLGPLDSQPPLTKKQLDDLDWLAAEREARPIRAIGIWIAP